MTTLPGKAIPFSILGLLLAAKLVTPGSARAQATEDDPWPITWGPSFSFLRYAPGNSGPAIDFDFTMFSTENHLPLPPIDSLALLWGSLGVRLSPALPNLLSGYLEAGVFIYPARITLGGGVSFDSRSVGPHAFLGYSLPTICVLDYRHIIFEPFYRPSFPNLTGVSHEVGILVKLSSLGWFFSYDGIRMYACPRR